MIQTYNFNTNFAFIVKGQLLFCSENLFHSLLAESKKN